MVLSSRTTTDGSIRGDLAESLVTGIHFKLPPDSDFWRQREQDSVL